MKISIFTPTYDPSFLPRIYESLISQTDPSWEWIVLYNNGAQHVRFEDQRVREIDSRLDPISSRWVGALKAEACDEASGDIFLELDHDDLLMPAAIEEVRRVFEERPEVGFVYSNIIWDADDPEMIKHFDERQGWEYRQIRYGGEDREEHVSFDPSPMTVSRIWYAPNHLRAFRRSVYDEVGGYSRGMRVLDDQDLMSRLYKITRFYHIDKPLYVYRSTGKNTCYLPDLNQEIQQNVLRLYDIHIEDMAVRWAEDRDLRLVELGGRMAARRGFETVDLKDADVVADLNGPWPFDDGSVGVVRAYDVFEHLRDSIHTMKELYRVLAPGGYAFIQVPSTDGRGAFQDPTHVSYWNQNSFLYYTDRRKNRYIDCPVRFHPIRMYTTEKDALGVCWTRAHLVKLVDGMRVPGEVLI